MEKANGTGYIQCVTFNSPHPPCSPAFIASDYSLETPMNAAIQVQQAIELARFQENMRFESKLKLMEARQLQKLQVEEYRQTLYHTVSIDTGGSIIAETKSNITNSPTRCISNLQHPVLTMLIHYEDDSDFVWHIGGKVGNKELSICLDATKSGTGSYLCQKFAANGIAIFADSLKSKKMYAVGLMRYLINACNQTFTIYDNRGWHSTPDKNFVFTKEVLTWSEILKLTR